jgi:FkbM family methyltransferase
MKSGRLLARAAASRQTGWPASGKAIEEALAAEREWRRSFFDLAGRITPYLGLGTSRLTFIVSTHDMNIGRRLFVSGSRKEMRTLENVIEVFNQCSIRYRGTTFIDLGANIGTACLTAVREHGFGAAVACEPEAENFRILRANIVINGLDTSVSAFNVAVTDRIGRADLRVRRDNSALHSLSGSKKALRRAVKTTTVDALLKRTETDPDDVGLLWMDIQGSEGQALAGARTLAERGTPIVFELSPGHLAPSDGLSLLADVVQNHYTHILDLGTTRSGRDPDFLVAKDVRQLADAYPDGFTDVLACRLPST